ncbi:filamentous hemagglutinin N-terminal domain-containing protein [Scytonema sp. UIC 10036]|uniref:two-partner secretion domain-containing protein n=1 Tax=Scytonema sp. UIC 10036 TaxID=2304196 RepID=UPI0012DA5444|nr:filamentous hemagglutinin N-terminal domain-containing protein [Scytonema sp. UIC 10036]MUG91019.1 filamentous hemagglutinin N-terminal domain-containing protein [Scytonema sp. UIC 10036]
MRWGAFLRKIFAEHVWLLSGAGLLGCAGAIALSGNSAIAQNSIIPDTTLGSETSSVVSLDESFGIPIDVINGGAIRGVNLFHSFQEFNVAALRGVYFLNPDNAIQNILARVTGNNRSEILGTLGILNAPGITSRANVFLMNPNGIIFGPNAQLDISGSFVATTANAIAFPDGAEFSVNSGAAPQNQLLRVNPSAFLFNQVAAQGSNSIENKGILAVPNGRSLLLVGGRVAPTATSTGQILVDGGKLNVFGGRIEIGGLTAPGMVGLTVDGNSLRLSYPAGVARADISFVKGAFVNVAGAGGGDIAINANNLNILEYSILSSGLNLNQGSPGSRAGDILINATGVVTIADDSTVNNTGLRNSIGDAGDIKIVARSLNMTNGAQIQSSIFGGQGNAGNISIQVEGSVSLSGIGADTNPSGRRNPSAIISNVVSANLPIQAPPFFGIPISGNSGSIDIQGRWLSLADGSSISTTSLLGGKSGDIRVEAFDSISMTAAAGISATTFSDENAENVSIVTKSLNLNENAIIATNTFGRGNAANITIDTQQLLVRNGGAVSATSSRIGSSDNVGRGGNIIVNASDSIEVDGVGNITGFFTETSTRNRAGDLTLNTRTLTLRNGGVISSGASRRGSLGGNGGNLTVNASELVEVNGSGSNSTELRTEAYGIGNAGDLIINTRRLQVIGNGVVSTSTYGQGNAGNIFVHNSDIVEIDSGVISSAIQPGAVGNAGDIEVNTKNLFLTNGALIDTRTFSRGNAGTIKINASNTVSLDRNAGVVSALELEAEGKAGDIELSTRNLSLTNGASIDIRTLGKGNAGTVNINVRDTLYANNGNIRTDSRQSSGGAIAINAKDMRLFGDSDISTFVFSGAGGGGNITLTADSIIAFNDSDILAFASDGRGGDITFQTPAFFGDRYEPASPGTNPFNLDGNNRVDINASGRLADGSITLPDVSFLQNSLTELPQTPIDTNALIANSCIARNSGKQENTFTITGSGGLPNRPGDASISSYSTGDVRDVQGDSASRSWHKGDPIVEPSGVYRLPSGKLILSRECS